MNLTLSKPDIDLIREMLPDFIAEANGILFYRGDARAEFFGMIATRYHVTVEAATKAAGPLVKIVDHELVAA